MENLLKLIAHRLILVGCIGFSSSFSYAFIDVNPKFVDIENSSLSINIENRGDNPEFVNIELFQIENPGVSPNEEKLTSVGLIGNPYLYATPFKLTLQPRQIKKIEIKVLHQPKKELVYRLSVMPQREIEVKESKNNIMNVGLGYLILIRQIPMNKNNSWSYSCIQNGMNIEATGTIRVMFSDVKVDTHSVDNFNVYPGIPRFIEGKNIVGLIDDKEVNIKC
ncbi:hypothetical protein [Providencia sp. PROV129]|uniref:hypothetical protein n=1 Tax=Providencia sp. PROV129 TaxID=2949839 RepID=UPI00234964D9|nr:hypothetical protein [Providencia sp. PROV129]